MILVVNNRRLQDRLVLILFVTVFALSTISLTKTTLVHASITDIFRWVLILVISLVSCVYLFAKIHGRAIGFKETLGVIFPTLFFSLGIIGSLVNGGIEYFTLHPVLIVSIVLGFVLSYLLSCVRGQSQELIDLIERWLFFYFLFALIFLLLSGGLIFSYPPKYVFEYDGVLYSQGISKFFGMASILSCSAFIKSYRMSRRWLACVFLLFVFTYLFVSFLAGGRGDFSLALLLVIVVLSKLGFLFLSVLVSVFVFFIIIFGEQLAPLYQGFLILERFQSLFDGNLGQRDILLSQSVGLLSNEASCLFFGCGFNYFQYFYNFEYGRYPHNLLSELLITFGVPATLFIISFVFIGILEIFLKRGFESAISMIGVYILLVSLKSGSLFDFLVIGYLTYFFVEGFFMAYVSWRKSLNEECTNNGKDCVSQND